MAGTAREQAGIGRLLGSWRAVAGELQGSIANELAGTACGGPGLSVD